MFIIYRNLAIRVRANNSGDQARLGIHCFRSDNLFPHFVGPYVTFLYCPYIPIYVNIYIFLFLFVLGICKYNRSCFTLLNHYVTSNHYCDVCRRYKYLMCNCLHVSENLMANNVSSSSNIK